MSKYKLNKGKDWVQFELKTIHAIMYNSLNEKKMMTEEEALDRMAILLRNGWQRVYMNNEFQKDWLYV